MASVSGSVLAGYAGVGVELKYLIAASFMAAPGGFLMAKMMIPECEKPRNDLEEVEVEDNSANVIDAAATGASSGLQLAMNVGAMLLAFVALIALVNGILAGLAVGLGILKSPYSKFLVMYFSPLPMY